MGRENVEQNRTCTGRDEAVKIRSSRRALD
jgi:hypothetical protein